MSGPKLSTAELMITPVKAGESAVGADDELVAYVDVAGVVTCLRIRPAVRHGQALVFVNHR